jgi:hypothetical protein
MNLDDYIPVAERIQAFIDRYPEGSLQPLNLEEPYTVIGTGDTKWIVYTAAAYRTADDTRPGVGIAWEPVPGRTPFTKGSELMVAESSAWGRAIVALGISANRGIASREEVRNATGGQR